MTQTSYDTSSLLLLPNFPFYLGIFPDADPIGADTLRRESGVIIEKKLLTFSCFKTCRTFKSNNSFFPLGENLKQA